MTKSGFEHWGLGCRVVFGGCLSSGTLHTFHPRLECSGFSGFRFRAATHWCLRSSGIRAWEFQP